jgi:hypothetical protein
MAYLAWRRGNPPLLFFFRGENQIRVRRGVVKKSHPLAIAKSLRGLNFNHIVKIGNVPLGFKATGLT